MSSQTFDRLQGFTPWLTDPSGLERCVYFLDIY